MTESQTKGLGALVTSLLTLVLLALGALLIQPRLTERRQLLPDRYVLTADEVAALPQGTLPVVLDRRLGQDQNDFRFRLLKLVLERSGYHSPWVSALPFSRRMRRLQRSRKGRRRVGGTLCGSRLVFTVPALS